jgi:hypothetical protein
MGATRPHNPAARGELLGATARGKIEANRRKTKPTLNTKLRILPCREQPSVRLALPKLFFCAHQFLDDFGKHIGLVSELGLQRCNLILFFGQRPGAGPPAFKGCRSVLKEGFLPLSKTTWDEACACRKDPKPARARRGVPVRWPLSVAG